MSPLSDHIDHNVVKDEAELYRYPVTLTVEDGIVVFEVDYDADREYLSDVESSDAGLYCATCDTEVAE